MFVFEITYNTIFAMRLAHADDGSIETTEKTAAGETAILTAFQLYSHSPLFRLSKCYGA